jgi:hypothetical protein
MNRRFLLKLGLIFSGLVLSFVAGWFGNNLYQDNDGSVYAWRSKWFGNTRPLGVSISGPNLFDAQTDDYVGVVWGICREPRSKQLMGYQIWAGRTSADRTTKLVPPDNVVMR